MSAKRLSIISTTIALALGSTVAFAGGPDTPSCSPALAHGFYIGAGPNYSFGTSLSQWNNSPTTFRLGMRGWGGQMFAGYDYMFLQRFYAGANIFFSMNDVKTKGTVTTGVTGNVNLDYVWGVSVEPGFMPADNVHLYGKLGVADGYLELKDQGTTTNDYSSMGWFLGAGAEVAVSHDFGIRSEYKYFDFGKKSSGTPNATVRPRFGMFSVSLTYHFS